MALGYNVYHGGENKSPGLIARENQLADAKKDRQSYTRDSEMPTTGNVSTKQQVAVAQRALVRQQRYAAGKFPVP